jgi:hypothetical protein
VTPARLPTLTMIATFILGFCLTMYTPLHPPPYLVEVYSVRVDGAGHACDCALAPCGARAPGCEECDEVGTCSPCPLMLEPGCFITRPDLCGNAGPCAYLDIHAFPAAMSWRFFEQNNNACVDPDFTEVRVGWMSWWRVR